MVETMEAMMRDPSTQQLLLARMPPHMRRPEVVKAMLANPEVRQRIAALAQQTVGTDGLNHMMGGLQADRVIAGVDATRKAGVDPGALFSRFMSSPSLAARLKDPRVLAALADVVQHGPQALSKYSGDKEVVEAWNEAAGILEQLQRDDPQPRQQQDPQQGCCGVGGNGSGGGGQAGRGVPTPPGAQANQAEAMARAGRALGAAPEELVARAMARPELLQRVQDPEVQKALLEISQSPWKAVKYLLNPKVMGALKEVREALKEDQAKQ